MTSLSQIADSSPTRRATYPELVIVFGLTVGLSWASLVAGALSGHPRAELAFTSRHLGALVLEEVVLAALLVPWLARRGWSVRDAGAPEPFDVLRGVGLWGATMLAYVVVWWTFAVLEPNLAQQLATQQSFPGGATPALAIATSVVNPVFEEFLWLGYGVTALESRIGLRAACIVSVALRVSVHAYQGILAVLAILPIGLVLTWYYASTRRLWPVIVAHVLLDTLGLAQYLAR